MTKSQIQMKLEKLVIQGNSSILLRQKYVGNHGGGMHIYGYPQKEITHAQLWPRHINTGAIQCSVMSAEY